MFLQAYLTAFSSQLSCAKVYLEIREAYQWWEGRRHQRASHCWKVCTPSITVRRPHSIVSKRLIGGLRGYRRRVARALTLVAICGRKRNRRGRTCYVANPRKESEPMKVLWILGKVTALTSLMALGGAGAYAQAEIDPDHFDSPNTEPFDQPMTQSQAHATRYDGNFSLPYAVQCRGKQLAPGKYPLLLRGREQRQSSNAIPSDGKVGHGVLKSKSQLHRNTAIDSSEFQEFAKPWQPVSSPLSFRWVAEIGS